MTAPTEPRILAEVGGLAVAEQGPLIVVVDRGTGPLATVAFVLGVLALVPGGFGAVTLALSATDGAAVPWWVFVDADGVVVAPLDQVRFQRRTQLTSSSPMLVAVTPGGAFTLKRGNPFNGGFGNLEDVLTAAVFGPTR
jgi:hypothetical protein